MSIETEYKTFTVKELVDFVKSHPERFSMGMDTPIIAGDFEGNYNHRKFCLDSDGQRLFIGFELHE